MESEARGVVVGYDGTAGSDAALDWAAALAQRQGLPLTVLYSLDVATAPVEPAYTLDRVAPDVAASSQAGLEAGLERAAKVLDRSQVHGARVVGGPAAELVNASEGAEFVVTGSRGRGRFAGGLLGSVSYAVTAHAKCPAVVVRGEEPASPDAEHPVVVGIDDSEAARRALDLAAGVAAAAGATLRIVHVGPMHVAESWAYVETAAAGSEHSHAVRAEAEETLAQAEQRVRGRYPDLTVEAEGLYGKPGHVLSDLSATAGLVVVGSRGRGGFTGLLLGSVSHTVIHEAACPVMVDRG
jgi:nucleotide-binding universal stress UspA family protein